MRLSSTGGIIKIIWQIDADAIATVKEFFEQAKNSAFVKYRMGVMQLRSGWQRLGQSE